MSGVFGIISPRQAEGLGRSSGQMAAALQIRPWVQTPVWADEAGGAGLGQANIGIFGTEQQPARNTAGVIAFVFGEFYNAETLQGEMQKSGHACQDDSPAELVLRIYEVHGEALPGLLEGCFALAVWDAPRQKLILANDRLGLLPHYYAHFDGKLAFAPLVNAILRATDFERRLNLDAVAQFLRFQRLLGDNTFFEGLHLLPYGSILVYEAASDRLSVRHYWDFDQIPSWTPGVSFEEAVVETGRLLRRAVQKRLAGPYRPGVYLSGGLDSRTILGFGSQMGAKLPSVTYGFPTSDDVTYARQLARHLGSPNHFFPQENGRWLKDFADLHLTITEGHTSFIHAHASLALEASRQWLDVNLMGFNGDQFLGARAVEHATAAVNAPDDLAFLAILYQNFTHDFSWPGLTESEEKLLYRPEMYAQMRERAFESLRQELRPYLRFAPPQRLDYFTTVYQGTRLSNLNAIYMRAFFEVRYPFCDAALSDFVLSMPIEYRLHDRLYLAVISREIPAVTRIPRDTDGLLPTDRQWVRKAHALGRKIDRHLIQPLRPHRPAWQRLHGDPENWLRNDLGEWAAGILFDPRTTSRAFFDPAFVRSLLERHLRGKELWTVGKVAPLVTFEMMLRRFYD